MHIFINIQTNAHTFACMPSACIGNNRVCEETVILYPFNAFLMTEHALGAPISDKHSSVTVCENSLLQ